MMIEKLFIKMHQFLVLLSSILIIISILGSFSYFGHYNNYDPKTWEKFDENLYKNAKDMDSLYAQAELRASAPLRALPPEMTMKILYQVVIERFTHGNQQYNLFSNWILWLPGIFNPDISHIFYSNDVLFYGHSAFCSETSYILLLLAEKSGIQARHVGLYGHVVMEAWYKNNWHLYDPDLEVIPEKDGNVLSVRDISIHPELVDQFYENRGDQNFLDNLKSIYTHREYITYATYPRKSWFNWKSDILVIVDQVTKPLKFIIPIIVLIYSRNKLKNTRMDIL